MDLIDWRFSANLGRGCRIASLGLMGVPGIGFAVKKRAEYEATVTNATTFIWTQALVPPSFTSGMIAIHFVITAPSAAMALPAELTITYNGQALTFSAAYVQQTTAFVIQGMAYLFLEDVTTAGNLVVNMSAAGYAGGQTVTIGVDVMFCEGIDPDTAGVFRAAGTVDVYAAALTLDPGPDPVEHEIVLTGAAQARTAAAASTLTIATDRYTGTGSQLSTEFGLANTATWFCETGYNCACEVDPGARTLLAMRRELMMRTGFASQLATPPPGIPGLFDSYLRGAQETLYRRYTALQTERFFSWELRAGYRYYGLFDNTQCCEVKLDRYKVTGAWIEDLNHAWWPLGFGINPTSYTLDRNFGWPTRIEIRQCVEVFPAPQAAGYKLWIRGHFGLNPFTADTDMTTIDAEPVFLWALALAKSHKGDRDAGLPTLGRETGYYGQAIAYIKSLVAGSHMRRRYVPGVTETPLPTPPVMTQFLS